MLGLCVGGGRGRRDEPKRCCVVFSTSNENKHDPNVAVLFHVPFPSCCMFHCSSGQSQGQPITSIPHRARTESGLMQFGWLSIAVVFVTSVPFVIPGSCSHPALVVAHWRVRNEA